MLKKEKKCCGQLVVVGEQGWKFNKTGALSGIDSARDVRFIGYVPDEDLSAIYTMADMLAFPTLYEGFGIPILEAQRCGTPVLTSNCSSLPEVGGMSALYVDPGNIDDICSGMDRILSDPEYAGQLRRLGYENVKRFSWESSAKKLDEIIESVIRQ